VIDPALPVADKQLTENGKAKTLHLPFEFDALVVNSIKEQQSQIDRLSKENEILKAKK